MKIVYKKGDHVRISNAATISPREYDETMQGEIFTTYDTLSKIKDLLKGNKSKWRAHTWPLL